MYFATEHYSYLPNSTDCLLVPLNCLCATIPCNIKDDCLKSTKLQRCTKCLFCNAGYFFVTILHILQTFSNALLETETEGTAK